MLQALEKIDRLDKFHVDDCARRLGEVLGEDDEGWRKRRSAFGVPREKARQRGVVLGRRCLKNVLDALVVRLHRRQREDFGEGDRFLVGGDVVAGCARVGVEAHHFVDQLRFST